MDYQVIARRYRPRRFDEVVGQESAAETLRAGIVQERTAHAYLFSGPRGVGKTSMARIFAKALNCPKAADRSTPQEEWAIPCDACPTCDAIHLGQDIDVVEMDGASHRGIEDIRTIVEGVSRPATRSPHKIYIIDEVHMLTREAFNALLKTLEEPPPHVRFIFATTEAHRIPETVLSRCQRFEFQPIGVDSIVRRLGQILEMEKRAAEDGLLERIAQYGRGGLRDAQTLLDQLMTFDEGELQSASLERITGRVSYQLLEELVRALGEGVASSVLALWRRAIGGGADPAMVLEQILETLREEVHRRVSGGQEGEPVAEVAGLDRLLGSIQVLLDVAGKLRHSAYPDLSVEVALLKVARLEEPAELEAVVRQLQELAEQPAGSTPRAVDPVRANPAGAGAPVSSPGAPVPSAGAPVPPAGAPFTKPRWGDSSAAPGAEPTSRERPPPTSGGSGAPQGAVRPPAAAAPQTGPGTSGTETATLVCDPPSPTQASPPPSPAGDAAPAVPREDAGEDAREALDAREFFQLWDQICIELEKRHPEIAPFFKGIVPKLMPERPDTLRVDFHDEFFQRQMAAPRRQKAFEDVVHAVTRAPWRFVMGFQAQPAATPAPPAQTGEAADPPATRSAPTAGAPAATPAGASVARPQAAPPGTAQEASRRVAEHPLVQKSLDLFKGRLV